MLSAPTLAEQELLAETARLRQARLRARDRAFEIALAAALAGATATLWLLRAPGGLDPLSIAVCLLVFAVANRVQFETPFGFTVATQLAFVPLMFAVPAALLPVAVVVGLTASQVPELLRSSERRARRLLLMPGNAWFAVGPALVLALSGVAPPQAGLPLLVAALAAQFALDAGVSSIRFWWHREATLRQQLADSWVYVVDAALSAPALVFARQVRHAPLVVPALLPLLGLLALFAHERRRRIENLLELNGAYRGTALVLGDVVEADDGYTGEHSRSVLGLCLELGRRLGLDAERLRNLEFAALLHDVGKIVIPKEIINKPGKLDPGEWRLIETHTIKGQQMLDRIGGFMRSVGLIVRSHHERWDGGGYPDGLTGEQIPLEARIIACCDSWNAMRTDRSYRRALPLQDARAEMIANAGTQFDPGLVPLLLEVVPRAADQPGVSPSAETGTWTSAGLPVPRAA